MSIVPRDTDDRLFNPETQLLISTYQDHEIITSGLISACFQVSPQSDKHLILKVEDGPEVRIIYNFDLEIWKMEVIPSPYVSGAILLPRSPETESDRVLLTWHRPPPKDLTIFVGHRIRRVSVPMTP